MDKKILAALVLLAAIGSIYSAWSLGVPADGASSGKVLENIAANGDLFEGVITNKNVVPGTFGGVGVYDKNCVSAGNGLTNCHGGINTEKYGVLDFNYVHDMAKKPCIAPNDKVVVNVLDSSGKATVQKVY